MRRSLLSTLLCVAIAACSSNATPAAQNGAPAPQQPARTSADVITAQELAGASSYDLYAAIQRLRPSFLQARGTSTFGNAAAGSDAIQVYVDGMHRGGVTTLRDLNASDVGEVRRLSAAEATQRFGTGLTQGAILVTLKR